MTLTVGSLFSGIGGIDLGLRMAGGFETRWFCETDPYCVRVLNKHWPDVRVYGDIRELRGSDIEPVDVLVGGFPCQPVSVAGRGLGDADERWLWPEFARLIRELRPRWVLAENVPGLRSIDDGRLFGTVLRDLAACGYDAEWDCIPAAAVGAHHLRDRLWIVAYPDDSGCDKQRRSVPMASEQLPPQCGGSSHANANGQRHGTPPNAIFAGRNPAEYGDRWAAEPRLARLVHGVSGGVDRRRGLGNAVVPQVVEPIGRRIVTALGAS